MAIVSFDYEISLKKLDLYFKYFGKGCIFVSCLGLILLFIKCFI